MNDETPAEKRPLTINDPIDAETLKQFKDLQEARRSLADNLLALEQEKIHILAGVKKVDLQLNRLFEMCNIDRGLAPETKVTIDAVTGQVTLDEAATSG